MVTSATRRWALGLAGGVALIAGCREVPATQLLVVVDSDLAVDRELNRVTVSVTDPSGQNLYSQRDFRLLPTARPAAYALPISFGVVPIEGDAARRVRVIVEARTADTGRRIELTALAGFLPDRKLLLTMFLERACVGVDTCGVNETCVAGRCQSAERPSLPDVTDQATVDASGLFDVARPDAVVDATATDTAVDAPVTDAASLPTPQLVYPTPGALTNTRLLGFEARATNVPAGASAFLEVSRGPTFVATETVTVAVPTPAAVGGVTTWTVSSLDADTLTSPGGPIGSEHQLWWRIKLSLPSVTLTRSVAWPFRLRPAQPGRVVTGAQRFRAVGQAGDFDGNGASDVLVVNARSGAADGASLLMGRTFSRVVEHTVRVSQSALDFGRAARLGDLNADGLEDFAVATGFPGGTGGAGASGGLYLVLGTTSPDDRTPEPVASITPAATTDPLRVAAVMDSDRDGVGEFVVGFPATGALRVYRGLAGARAGRFVELAPTVAGADPNLSLSTAGDVNGDGRGDFVVGHGSRGDAELYLAADVGGVASFERVPLSAGGLASTAGFGASVTGGGDVNGDGFSDVVVAGDAGLRVYFGGVTGVVATSTFVDPSPCAPGAFEAPRRVANLGDLNGDGGDEVGIAHVGVCMIVLRAPLAAASTSPALVEQRTLFAPAGESTWASTIAAVGDYDDDNLGDFALAIPHLDDPTRSTVKVYFGDPTAWAEGQSGDGGVAPTSMVVTPNSRGWGYSVASRRVRREGPLALRALEGHRRAHGGTRHVPLVVGPQVGVLVEGDAAVGRDRERPHQVRVGDREAPAEQRLARR